MAQLSLRQPLPFHLFELSETATARATTSRRAAEKIKRSPTDTLSRTVTKAAGKFWKRTTFGALLRRWLETGKLLVPSTFVT